jgi:hypothetical protein
MEVMTPCYDPINFKGYPHHMKFSLNLSAEAFTREGVEKLEAIGIEQVYLGFHDIYSGKEDERTLQQKIEHINWYGETIIRP